MSLSEKDEAESFDNASTIFKKKKLEILQAEKQNDVNTLKSLLDSPKWYITSNSDKDPLLHLAIYHDHKEVFDFLLSLPDYPLELVDSKGYTALMKVFKVGRFAHHRICEQYDTTITREYYALKLIEKGADIHRVSDSGKNLVHLSLLQECVVNIAEVLIERGVDINHQDSEGDTPFHALVPSDPLSSFSARFFDRVNEGVAMLLYHGADPLIRNFKGFTPLDLILRWGHEEMSPGIEILLYYMFDQFTEYEMDAAALVKAAQLDSSIFYEITKVVRDVVFNCGFSGDRDLLTALFEMKTHHLQVLIEKYDFVMEEFLLCRSWRGLSWWLRVFSLKNFYLLMESKLHTQFIGCLRKVDFGEVFYWILKRRYSLSTLEKFILIVLSYGSVILGSHVITIYEKFGYCDLFKILLHMKAETPSRFEDYEGKDLMGCILCNVTSDLPKRIKIKQPRSFPDFSRDQLKKLSPYYTIPCYNSRVPLLVELARDVFRRYFIEIFEIKNASQFYTLIARLPISTYHKKVITLEQKLYEK